MNGVNTGLAELAALAAALAVWLALSPTHARRRLAAVAPEPARRWRWLASWPILTAVPAGLIMGSWGGVGPGLAVGFAAGTVLWLVRGQLRHREAGKRQKAVVAACRALAGLLRVGHIPAVAVRAVATDSPVLSEAAAVQGVGGEVAPVLRRCGAVPGQSGLTDLANAWQVAEWTGASLTATLDALADRLVAQESVAQTVESELAGPRSTGRLLAALPGAGIALGFLMGGDPLAFLTGSVLGQSMLVAGVALACLGVRWTERIADARG